MDFRMSHCDCTACRLRRYGGEPEVITLTEPELDKLLSEAYADGRSDQLEEMKEKTT